MSDIERELGRLAGAVEAVVERVDRIDIKLDRHVQDEETRLKGMHEQLSLLRFVWLTAKAVVLTIAFSLAFKFGDISGLWRSLK